MKDLHVLLAALTSVILFVFGLDSFTKEIQKISGERFRKFLARSTRYPVIGVFIGAILTALIQSSSATSVIAISLVNAGVLSFKNSVGVIFGSNIGTTITAQLLAFELTSFAPFFIIIGYLLNFFRSKFSIFSKSLFYFGFVFFALNLISSSLAPLQSDQRVLDILMTPHNTLYSLLIGVVITALVHSSAVTTGLAIIFTQQGLMSLDNAIPILMGANIGTTVTALIAIINMDTAAKKTALAHLLFNIGGVMIFYPLILFWKDSFYSISDHPAQVLANFHLVFNLVTTIVFVVILKPFVKIIESIMGDGRLDFDRIDLSFTESNHSFKDTEDILKKDIYKAFNFVKENYNLVTLSIETNYKGIYEVTKKRLDYTDYLRSELIGYFSRSMVQLQSKEDTSSFIKVMNAYEYIFQIHDSIKDISRVKDAIDTQYIDLHPDLISMIRSLSSSSLRLFEVVSVNDGTQGAYETVKKEASAFQSDLDHYNKEILVKMSESGRGDAWSIMHLITYSQRLKDKLVHYYRMVYPLVEKSSI